MMGPGELQLTQQVVSGLHTCQQCQLQVEPSATFCPQCGGQLGVSATTMPPPASFSPRSVPALEKAPADPLIGAVVADRYRIDSMIGRGGMGVVYRVEHSKIGKVMALKLLTGELARNKDTVRRFKREALMVSKLSHPNTVQVFDFGSAGGLTYLAMEFLAGFDLGELIERQGAIPFSQLAKIIIPACGALQEAHDVGMVHRDIKPENLFVTRTPTGEELVKVLDFGLAKLRESRELNDITSTGNIVGTPYYMPPEQVRGEEVDARGDVYAMSALLYTCLTATHVFEAPSPIAVLTAQVSQAPEPPHLRAPQLDISLSVSALIMKGLAKDPRDRFQSITELGEALLGELSGESRENLRLTAPAPRPQNDDEAATRGEVELYERSLKRRERLAQVVGLGLLLALSYGGFHTYQKSQRPQVFNGREVEPNHTVEDALKVPFGKTVRGRIGQRLTKDRGDQDNYLVTVPPSSTAMRTQVNFQLSALPNLALCAWLFKKGQENPLFKFCSGAPGQEVRLRQLALQPVEYLIAIRQDQDKYRESQQTYVHENISDDYQFTFSLAKSDDSLEIEPNNGRGNAGVLHLSSNQASQLRGELNFMHDKDIVCAQGSDWGKFSINDAEGGRRPRDALLQITPLGGPNHKIPIRLHGPGGKFEESERDQRIPWTSPPLSLKESPCVSLTLVPNPWAPRPHVLTAPSSSHQWVVTLTQAEEPRGASVKKKH